LLALLLAGCAAPPAPQPPAAPGTLEPAWAWEARTAAPTPRTEVAAAALDGRIYVVGGFDSSGANVATVEVYDPAADSWRPGPAYPIPIHHTVLVAHEGSVWGFGGFTSAAFVPTNLVFRLQGGAWQAAGTLPVPRAAGAGAVLDGKLYLFGGFGLGQQLLGQVDVFDLATQAWARGPDLPTPRDHLGAAALEGRVWAVGGEEGGHGANVDALEALDPASRRWEAKAPLLRPRGSLQAATLGGGIVAVGGQDLQETYPDADHYDPARDAWRALPPMPTARHGLGVAVVGEQLYVLAGGPQPGQSVTGAVEVLGAS
jgi:N-acetylneuraminic acid mutarotase